MSFTAWLPERWHLVIPAVCRLHEGAQRGGVSAERRVLRKQLARSDLRLSFLASLWWTRLQLPVELALRLRFSSVLASSHFREDQWLVGAEIAR